MYYWKDTECIALLFQTLPLHLHSSLGMALYHANPPQVLISLTLLHSSSCGLLCGLSVFLSLSPQNERVLYLTSNLTMMCTEL